MSAVAVVPDSRAARGGEAASWTLNPIEELDCYLEDPWEPRLVRFELHARGHLDQAVLGQALESVLAADPAARRRLAVSRPWRRNLRWEVLPSTGQNAPLAVAGWRDREDLDALRESLTTTPIPLRRSALRLTLAVGPDSDVLFLQVHHAAFDGISGLALMSAICAAYRDRVDPDAAPDSGAGAGVAVGVDAPDVTEAPVAPVAGSRRESGGKRGHGEPVTGSRIPGAVMRIAPRVSGPALPGYGFVQWTAPVPRPPHGAGPRPTVNDLLVAALILAVNRWNAARRPDTARRPNAARRRGRISIAVPVNIRDGRHRWTGPGNQSRLIRVTARPGDCEHPAGLLARVSTQTRLARERPRPGLDGASRLLGTGWAPTGLKRVVVRLARRLATPVVTDTALASNLGVIPAPLESLWFSGPAPLPRGLGVGALTAGGRLHLTIVYSRALFDAAAGADFAAVYRRALEELAPHATATEHPKGATRSR